MLAKLNQYRQTLSFPLNRTKKSQSQYHFEWVEDLKQLKEVQKFRAEQFAEQFRQPEIFMHVDDKIVAAPMPDEQAQSGMSY